MSDIRRVAAYNNKLMVTFCVVGGLFRLLSGYCTPLFIALGCNFRPSTNFGMASFRDSLNRTVDKEDRTSRMTPSVTRIY